MGSDCDLIYGVFFMYEFYIYVDCGFIGWVIILVLWDSKMDMIVNNESVDILCMFDNCFGDFVL